jgi:hypothetical protein
VTIAASVITAGDDEQVAEARRTIGFYASTPTYRHVLEHHGWASAADALAGHARHGRWEALAAEVTDEMLETFAVVAPASELRTGLERHADGLIDRAAPYAPFGSRAWEPFLP